MTRAALYWIWNRWYIVAFILINSALAGPLKAGLDDAVCWDPQEEVEYPCCQRCMIFCHCSLLRAP